MIGKTFNNLKVICISDHKTNCGKIQFVCRCKCGKNIVTTSHKLKSGHTKSCGCLRASSGGMWQESEYITWQSMKDRCFNPNNLSYKHYGGRGITVCERWRESFNNFFADMGRKPTSKHSLDRIDVNGNYEPSNCRWATWSEQNNNSRNNVFHIYNGERLTEAQIVRASGIDRHLIRKRMLYGKTLEEAIALGIPKNRVASR